MKKTLKYELFLLLRDPIAILIPILGLAYFVYGMKLLGFTGYNQMSWHLQLMYWWAALIGFKKSVEWPKKKMNRWLLTNDDKEKVIVSQWMSITIVIFIQTLILALIYVFIGNRAIMSVPLLAEAALIIFLHYGIGMSVCAGIGLFLGRFFPQQWGYILPLLITYFLGPLGYGFIHRVGQIFPKSLQLPIFGLLELGIHNDNLPMNLLYGFTLEKTLWIQSFFRIAVVLFLLFFVLRNHKKWKLGLFVLFVLSISSFALQLKPEGYLHQSVWQEEHSERQLIFTLEESETPVANGYFTKVDAKVSTENELKVNFQGEWTMTSPSDKIAMNLYQKFNVTHVQIDNQECSFNQQADFINVQLPERYADGDVLSLTMTYGGTPPNQYYASSKSTYLPSYFNWLPQAAVGSAFTKEFSLNTLPVYNKEPIEYDITWENQKNGKVIKSDENFGVTLFDGYYHNENRGEIEYLTTDRIDIDTLEKQLAPFMTLVDVLRTELDIPVREIKTVIGDLRNNTTVGSYVGRSRISGPVLFTDSMFISQSIDYLLTDGPSDESEAGLILNALSAILLDEDTFLRQPIDVQDAFIEAYLYWRFGMTPRDTSIIDWVEQREGLQQTFVQLFKRLNSNEQMTYDEFFAYSMGDD